MEKQLKVRTRGHEEEIIIKPLHAEHLNQILSLQEIILQHLPDQSWYANTSKEEFKEILAHTNLILGGFNQHSELITMGAYVAYSYHKHNYGYDLGFKGDDLLHVGQIDSTIVHPNYRGNKLQNTLCDLLEDFAQKQAIPIISATVSPNNLYSLNTFLKRGYHIENETIKYGGLKRYLLMKNLSL